MRVIAGIAKGTKLKVPSGLAIRPTTDRAKEALFSVVSEKVGEARVLDLYAGAGSLGIEALSRGAEEAVFVDSSKVATDTIIENLTRTGFLSKAVVLQTAVLKGVKRLTAAGKNQQFDLIFLDPPFKINIIKLRIILSSLVQNRLVKKESVVILEHSSKVKAPAIDNLELEVDRKYGDTTLSFYRSKAAL